MKKIVSLITTVLLIFAAIILILNYKNRPIGVDNNTDTSEEKLIGGDKDGGGCFIGAGYSWCERKQNCLRPWEEVCEDIKNPSTPQELLRNVDSPKDWKIELDSKLPRDCITKFITSPDFLMSEGYPILEKGGQISVRICKTEDTSIKNVFSSDSLRQSIAQNINEINLGTIPAIQYDFSYEGTVATETMFIYNNYSYLVKVRYVSVSDKQTYLDIYSGILDKLQHNLLDITPMTE